MKTINMTKKCVWILSILGLTVPVRGLPAVNRASGFMVPNPTFQYLPTPQSNQPLYGVPAKGFQVLPQQAQPKYHLPPQISRPLFGGLGKGFQVLPQQALPLKYQLPPKSHQPVPGVTKGFEVLPHPALQLKYQLPPQNIQPLLFSLLGQGSPVGQHATPAIPYYQFYVNPRGLYSLPKLPPLPNQAPGDQSSDSGDWVPPTNHISLGSGEESAESDESGGSSEELASGEESKEEDKKKGYTNKRSEVNRSTEEERKKLSEDHDEQSRKLKRHNDQLNNNSVTTKHKSKTKKLKNKKNQQHNPDEDLTSSGSDEDSHNKPNFGGEPDSGSHESEGDLSSREIGEKKGHSQENTKKGEGKNKPNEVGMKLSDDNIEQIHKKTPNNDGKSNSVSETSRGKTGTKKPKTVKKEGFNATAEDGQQRANATSEGRAEVPHKEDPHLNDKPNNTTVAETNEIGVNPVENNSKRDKNDSGNGRLRDEKLLDSDKKPNYDKHGSGSVEREGGGLGGSLSAETYKNGQEVENTHKRSEVNQRNEEESMKSSEDGIEEIQEVTRSNNSKLNYDSVTSRFKPKTKMPKTIDQQRYSEDLVSSGSDEEGLNPDNKSTHEAEDSRSDESERGSSEDEKGHKKENTKRSEVGRPNQDESMKSSENSIEVIHNEHKHNGQLNNNSVTTKHKSKRKKLKHKKNRQRFLEENDNGSRIDKEEDEKSKVDGSGSDKDDSGSDEDFHSDKKSKDDDEDGSESDESEGKSSEDDSLSGVTSTKRGKETENTDKRSEVSRPNEDGSMKSSEGSIEAIQNEQKRNGQLNNNSVTTQHKSKTKKLKHKKNRRYLEENVTGPGIDKVEDKKPKDDGSMEESHPDKKPNDNDKEGPASDESEGKSSEDDSLGGVTSTKRGKETENTDEKSGMNQPNEKERVILTEEIHNETQNISAKPNDVTRSDKVGKKKNKTSKKNPLEPNSKGDSQLAANKTNEVGVTALSEDIKEEVPHNENNHVNTSGDSVSPLTLLEWLLKQIRKSLIGRAVLEYVFGPFGLLTAVMDFARLFYSKAQAALNQLRTERAVPGTEETRILAILANITTF